MAYLYIFTAGSLWGLGAYLAACIMQMNVTSMLTAFSGQAIALPILLSYIILKQGVEGLKISKVGLFYAVLMGIVGQALFKQAYDAAIGFVGAATGSVLLYLSPSITAVMTFFIFNERLTFQHVFALMLNLFGCFMTVTGGNVHVLKTSLVGILLGLFASFLYALNNIIAKIASHEDEPETMTFYMLLVATSFTLFIVKPWNDLHYLKDPIFLFWSMLNGVLAVSVSNILFLKGIALGASPSKATIVASVEVIVASLLGVIFLSESMNQWAIIGLMMMLVSIVLMNVNIAQTKPKKLMSLNKNRE